MNNERTLTQIAEELERLDADPSIDNDDGSRYIALEQRTAELLCDALRIAVRRGNFMASTQREIERILVALEGK